MKVMSDSAPNSSDDDPTSARPATANEELVDAEPAGKPAAIDSSRAKRLLLTADLTAIGAGFIAAFAVQQLLRPVPTFIRLDQAVLAVMTLPAWFAAIATARLLDARAVERRIEEFRRVMFAAAFIVASLGAVGFAIQFQSLSRLWLGAVGISVVITMSIEREIARRSFARLRRVGRMNRRVVIIADSARAGELAASTRTDHGYEVCGYLDVTDHDDSDRDDRDDSDDRDDGVRSGDEEGVGDDADVSETHGLLRLGHVDDADDVLDRVGANGVIISLASVSSDSVNRLTRHLTDAGRHVALSYSLVDIEQTRLRPQSIDGRPMFYVEPTKRGGWRATAKRTFDLAFSTGALLLALPVIATSMLAIRLTSQGPAMFRQVRVGKDGAEFEILKLRTMVQDAEARRDDLTDLNEADGPLFKMAADPRVTSVGKFLRTTSIDELPQFVNVLRGEMSLVGPRPALPREAAEWTPEVHERLRVLPGITGMWQVSGRSDADFESYKRFDRYYVDNWSLGRDLNIIARTVGTVVGAHGAR